MAQILLLAAAAAALVDIRLAQHHYLCCPTPSLLALVGQAEQMALILFFMPLHLRVVAVVVHLDLETQIRVALAAVDKLIILAQHGMVQLQLVVHKATLVAMAQVQTRILQLKLVVEVVEQESLDQTQQEVGQLLPQRVLVVQELRQV